MKNQTKKIVYDVEVIESKPKSNYVVPYKNTSVTPYSNYYLYRSSRDKLRYLARKKYEPKRSYRPTSKQIRACEKIAEEKGLWLPYNYKTDWKVASGFITKFGDKA